MLYGGEPKKDEEHFVNYDSFDELIENRYFADGNDLKAFEVTEEIYREVGKGLLTQKEMEDIYNEYC